MAYNGHKNWNQWNVSLWINSDEWLYGMARQFAKRGPTREIAAQRLLDALQEFNQYKTPDGAPYTKTALLNAMRKL